MTRKCPPLAKIWTTLVLSRQIVALFIAVTISTGARSAATFFGVYWIGPSSPEE